MVSNNHTLVDRSTTGQRPHPREDRLLERVAWLFHQLLHSTSIYAASHGGRGTHSMGSYKPAGGCWPRVGKHGLRRAGHAGISNIGHLGAAW